jgi:hypothetical protein
MVSSVGLGAKIKDLFPAILEGLTTQFPDFKTVKIMGSRIDEKSLNSPCALLYPMDGNPVEDIGTEQTITQCRLVVLVMVSTDTGDNAVTAAYGLALQVMNYINRNQWGLAGITPAKVLGVGLSEFEPDSYRWECYQVEFTHDMTIGESVFEQLEDGVIAPVQTKARTNSQAEYDFLNGASTL